MENREYILTIDQGTTSTRAIIFDKYSNIIASSQIEIEIFCPKNGWVEQNPEEIYESVVTTIKNVIRKSKVAISNIKCIGITNQRETTIMWDKNTGKPVYHAIVWQSRQSQNICEEWIKKDFENKIKEKTGLLINPYFSASKIKWIFDNVDGVHKKALSGDIIFGTVDTYLLWKLTNGKVHITDYTNASRTMMFNIKKLCWDDEILKMFGIPSSVLPEVHESSEIYGEYEIENVKIPIASIVGDQQASLFGQCCFEAGSVKNTYGTGCFMLMNTNDKIISSNTGLLTTIAWGLNGEVEYALEGSVFVGGSAVQWLRDGMKMIKTSNEVELYSDTGSGSNGVYVVPAFVGLGTPYWDNDARGSVFGITRNTKKEHFINATVESIAFQSKDVMEVMKEASKLEISSLAVDGGASVNNYLMQFQSNILNCKIQRPKCLETTALGATYLAGLAVGVYKNKEELVNLQLIDKVFIPIMEEEKRNRLYEGWKKAIEATRVFK